MVTLRIGSAFVLCLATLGAAQVTAANTRSTALQGTPVPAHSSPLVYAINEFGYSATAFAPTANGNAAPTLDLGGSLTKIYEPEGLAVSRTGLLAVSDSANDVTLYAPGANGNVAPMGIITCGRGGEPGVPEQIAFDSRGSLYVKYYGGYHAPSDAIEVYKPSQQSGCVDGKHVLFGAQTGIYDQGGIAVAGDTIYSGAGNAVQEFHTSDNGNVAPFNVITGSNTGLTETNGIAVDKSGYVYVVNGQTVLVFAPSASGNVPPVAVIGGASTEIPTTSTGAISIAVSKNGTIFVGALGAVGSTYVSSLLVFAPGSNGNVAPRHVIAGSNTGLDWIAELGILE